MNNEDIVGIIRKSVVKMLHETKYEEALKTHQESGKMKQSNTTQVKELEGIQPFNDLKLAPLLIGGNSIKTQYLHINEEYPVAGMYSRSVDIENASEEELLISGVRVDSIVFQITVGRKKKDLLPISLLNQTPVETADGYEYSVEVEHLGSNTKFDFTIPKIRLLQYGSLSVNCKNKHQIKTLSGYNITPYAFSASIQFDTI